MSEPSLPELEAERDRLFAQLSVVGDFRRGSVSENWRRCGKPNCACAAPEHPGHGPRFLWTRSAGRRKTVARQLAAGEVGKVRREIARHAGFATTVEQIIEVNEKICEARPAEARRGHARGGAVRRSLRHVPWSRRPVRGSHVAMRAVRSVRRCTR